MTASLPQSFFARSALEVARDLIGCTFLFGGAGGRIVETEAYRQDDPCCHGYRGKTDRNAVLFGPPGHLYVYFTYGMHFCANIASEQDGVAAGVLLRALEPEFGIEGMAARRGVLEPRLLASGPARLAQALGIGRAQNGLPVWLPPLAILPRPSDAPHPEVVTTARIGVRDGDQKPWRFADAGSRHLSRPLSRTPILPSGKYRRDPPAPPPAPRPRTILCAGARPEQKGTTVKLREIYETAVRMGIEADPRGKDGVDEFLARQKKRHDSLPDHLKELADPQELTNPFADTRIYVGDPDAEVSTLLGGIDMNTGEVLLADRLRERGVPVDAIYTHHPESWGLTKLDSVMEVQADIWSSLGVPIQAGEKLIFERMDEVRRRLMPVNYDQAIDAARLLDMPFFSAHTPTDNLVVDFLNKWFAEKEPTTIEDVQKALLEIPEYRIAAQKGAGPYTGKSGGTARAGKIWVDMTGGTEGPKTVVEKLADAGVGTIVGMHMGQELRDEADKHSIHVIIAGHMSSDSLGINLFLDELERGGVKTIATSGLIRVHRDESGKVTGEEPGALPAR